jgi:hypothetical protein
MLTKEQLTPHALELFRRLVAELPPEIGLRLRSNRRVVTHGSYRTLFLFDIWDRNQIFDRQHFKYGMACDQRPGAPFEGGFGLWLNRIRIYRERESILATVDRELPRVVPPDFIYRVGDRASTMNHRFTYPADLAALPDLLLPHCLNLISAVHPVLMPIIDQFTTPLSSGDRCAAIRARGRLPFTHPGVADRERVREYTRSIPPSWRASILAQHDHRCANPGCRADLRAVPYHIDHILAFSKGGTTTRENLQPLCGPCNLFKGNRELQ